MADRGFQLTAPGTDRPLRRVDGALMAADGQRFEVGDDVWDFIRPERAEVIDRFAADYARLREAEHRTPADAAAVQALPYRDLSGRMTEMWAQRAASFDRFLAALAQRTDPRPDPGVAPPGQPGDRPRSGPTMIDVGAGCGWLAARLSAAGWRAAAADIVVDGGDGLGAARWQAEALLLLRAEMDCLPVAPRSLDLVVFNASLHYAPAVSAALEEAVRITRPGGTIAVLDSPVFGDPAAGRAMAQEFAEEARQRLGVEPAHHLGPGFVSEDDLARFRERHRPSNWTRIDERTGVVGGLRSLLGARRAGREIAKRPLLLIGTAEEVGA